MRFNTSVSSRDRKSIELKNLLGVDFSSAPINVSKKRASYAKNLISIDGVNQKRPGYRELFNFGKNKYVNGIFINKFNRNGIIDEIILVQVNGVFYRLEFDEKKLNYRARAISCFNGYANYEKNNFISQSFMSKNKLYIIGGGGYYVFYPQENIERFKTTEIILNSNGNKETIHKIYNKNDCVEYNGVTFYCEQNETDAYINPPSGVLGISNSYWTSGTDYYRLSQVVDGENTYIPTTTIGIQPNESQETTRVSLDKINLLSSFRINKLRGVDSNIECSEVFLDTYDETAKSGKNYYSLSNGNYTQVTDVTNFGGSRFRSNGYFEKFKVYTFNLDSQTIEKGSEFTVEITNLSGKIVLTNNYNKGGQVYYGDSSYDRFLFDNNGKQQGYIDINKGILYLFNSIDIAPDVIGDNITVRFVPYKADTTISKCEFGCRFGYKNNDTLFLSGNPNYPNQDFYSYTVDEDFSYFPVDNIQIFGTRTSAIKAYLQVADGTLAILKEPTSKEPTIYYRSITYSTNDLGESKIDFPVVQGAVGEGAVNANTVGTLIGDNLFVSPNGIFGLTLANNVVVNERYARERDRYIHSKLIKHDLSKSVAIVYKGRYILAVDNVCYILDSRFKSSISGTSDDTFSYECWYWDNIPAKCFTVYNNELYFGTEDGGICKFKNQDFTDDRIVDIGTVSITPVSDENDGNLVTFDRSFSTRIHNGSEIKLSFGSRKEKEYNFGVYTDLEEREFSINGNFHDYIYTFNFLEDITQEYYVGQEICLSSGKSFQGVVVKEVKNKTVIVFSQLGINLLTTNLKIYKTNLKEKKLYVTDFNNENSFKISDNTGEIIKIYGYSIGEVPNIEIIEKDPVISIWQSGVLDLSSYDYSKNLDSLSVVLSPDYHGKVRFGYETKRVSYDLLAKQINSAETETSNNFFDFDNIDFDNFTFETAFVSSYTKRIRERNINYIMFKAVSDDEQNSALIAIKVDYVIIKKNRGVR